ncbi:unnamed protein product [Diamesa serratosioi]
MNAANEITSRQKKGTLASLKKVKPAKNVLFRNIVDYWPELNDEQSEEFQELMKSYSGSTSIGLNSVLRNIKNNNVYLLAIADELSPKWFAKQLIAMSMTKCRTIKVVIVPKLKEISKELLKVPAIVFCLTKSENVEHLKDFDSWYHKLDIHEELLKHYSTIQPAKDISIKKKKKSPPAVVPINLTEVYLIKSEDGSRAFIPEEHQKVQEKVESMDFMSFSKSDVASIQQTKTPQYKQMKFKKVAGNPIRKKSESKEEERYFKKAANKNQKS